MTGFAMAEFPYRIAEYVSLRVVVDRLAVKITQSFRDGIPEYNLQFKADKASATGPPHLQTLGY